MTMKENMDNEDLIIDNNIYVFTDYNVCVSQGYNMYNDKSVSARLIVTRKKNGYYPL